ncbi:MAG: hypothetical protein OXQ29_05385 [Rhodospirillaceae bacterium]|nr:hypothetical protein [Rhodospirillaceae bacterium]
MQRWNLILRFVPGLLKDLADYWTENALQVDSCFVLSCFIYSVTGGQSTGAYLAAAVEF